MINDCAADEGYRPVQDNKDDNKEDDAPQGRRRGCREEDDDEEWRLEEGGRQRADSIAAMTEGDDDGNEFGVWMFFVVIHQCHNTIVRMTVRINNILIKEICS